jgi:GTP-binding protein HflX
LVEAFKATLEETVNSDLILHVVDASAPEEERDAMIAAVEEVLDEIGAKDTPTVLVLNKIDLLDKGEVDLLARTYRDAVPVSAATGERIDELRERIERSFRSELTAVELLVPFERGNVLSELHEIAGDLEREDTSEGVRVRARVPSVVAERLRPYSVNGRPGGSDGKVAL